MRHTGKDNRYIRSLNRNTMMGLIRTHQTLSKAQLALLSGLSPTAAGKIVKTLMKIGYIHETGTGSSKGGRRPMMLELNPDSFFSIGIEIDLNLLRFILMDITGTVKFEKEQILPDSVTFPEFIEKSNRIMETALKNLSIGKNRILGIGFSIPGIIDKETERILIAPNLGWESVDLKPYQEYFDPVPVYFENEANASAVYEHWMGLCKNLDNFVCINIKSGLGAGIFINGKLYTGSSGYAGEIGHTVIDENGPKCRCGKNGCIETYVSLPYILRNIRDSISKGKNSRWKGLDPDEIKVEKLIEAAREGDTLCEKALISSGKYIGMVAAQFINSLNPSRIVIGKDFVSYADLVIDQVRITATNYSLKYLNPQTEIIVSETNEKSSLLGAAVIHLKKIFVNE